MRNSRPDNKKEFCGKQKTAFFILNKKKLIKEDEKKNFLGNNGRKQKWQMKMRKRRRRFGRRKGHLYSQMEADMVGVHTLSFLTVP